MDGPYSILPGSWKRLDIRFRHDKHDAFLLHFIHLCGRNALLECAEVFRLAAKAVGLIEHLPPAVFAGGFCSKCAEFFGRKRNVVVLLCGRKKKVRLFLSFRDALCRVDYGIRIKESRKMMFPFCVKAASVILRIAFPRRPPQPFRVCR